MEKIKQIPAMHAIVERILDEDLDLNRLKDPEHIIIMKQMLSIKQLLRILLIEMGSFKHYTKYRPKESTKILNGIYNSLSITDRKKDIVLHEAKLSETLDTAHKVYKDYENKLLSKRVKLPNLEPEPDPEPPKEEEKENAFFELIKAILN